MQMLPWYYYLEVKYFLNYGSCKRIFGGIVYSTNNGFHSHTFLSLVFKTVICFGIKCIRGAFCSQLLTNLATSSGSIMLDTNSASGVSWTCLLHCTQPAAGFCFQLTRRDIVWAKHYQSEFYTVIPLSSLSKWNVSSLPKCTCFVTLSKIVLPPFRLTLIYCCLPA